MFFLSVSVLAWRYRRARTVILAGAFFCLGFWRYALGLPVSTPDKIWYYNGRTVTVEGVVANEADVRQTNRKLEVKAGKLERQEVSGTILATTNLYPAYDYGDELEMTCGLEAPEPFDDFAYDRYLARFDIYSVCYYPKIKKIAGAQGNKLYSAIFRLKAALRAKIDRGLSEPSASLASAIILGDKKGLPDDLRTVFARAGISHIAAISGMHISILAALLMGALLGAGLPRRYAFYASVSFLAVYIILIGLPASAMRAGLMGFLVLWALELGRLSKLTNSLVLAAAVLLLINPRLLRDDVGFELSFLAVAGIAYAYPLLDNRIKRRTERAASPLWRAKTARAAVSVMVLTASAQIFTLPVIAYDFSFVSLAAPLTNLLVLWCLPLLMILIIAALGISFLLPGLAVVFFAPARLLLAYITRVAALAAAMPGSSVATDNLWPGWIILWYAFAAGAIIYAKTGKKREKWL